MPHSDAAPVLRSKLAGLLTDALGHLDDEPSARGKIAAALRLVDIPAAPELRAGGLAPWQIKRLNAHIAASIERSIPIGEVALLVGFSASHFSRTFKKAFGQPFSRYVTAVRLERARRLLGDTDQAISDIALACGLSDQAHLTRLFSRRYGAPPNAWRRAHRRAQGPQL